MLAQLEGMLALAKGESTIALAHMRRAVELENTLPFGYGPAYPAQPSLEMLGEALISLDQFEEAQSVLSESLSRTSNKARSVSSMAAIRQR